MRFQAAEVREPVARRFRSTEHTYSFLSQSVPSGGWCAIPRPRYVKAMPSSGTRRLTFQTTAPVSSPDTTRTPEAPLGIVWVFPLSTNLVTLLAKPRLLVGRGHDCDVRLASADVSRRHALLTRSGVRWVVRDLGSRNGIGVNGKRLEEAEFAAGDVVRVGDWVGVARAVSWNPAERESLCRTLAQGLVGGPLLEQALAPARSAATSDLPVVIEGETGTGKECAARAIHEWSGRAGPFVGLNCAALPEGLAESELFGHKKGAFTGADRSRVGYLQAAHGGTLLLDEVTDLPLSVQPKLLRAIELRQVVPLGDSTPVSFDVRLVTASQESLMRAVQDRRFRGDLYARLSGLVVPLPALRARVEDVPSLFSHLLARSSERKAPTVDSHFVEALCLHDWPFNVRELDLLVRRLLALHAQEPVLRRSHLPPAMSEPRLHQGGDAPAGPVREPAPRQLRARAAEFEHLVQTRRQDELEALLAALRTHGGNVARAAQQVGISRQRAYRLMEGRADADEARGTDPPKGPG
jgi:DNA-binding NtrC family response regulator